MKKVAVILLRDARGKILLQHRTVDAPTYPNHWALFGGHIEEGETPEEALAREVMEELQYEVSAFNLFKIHVCVAGYTLYVFVEDYSGADLVLREGQGMNWFAPLETGHLLMNDHDREIIEEFAKAG